MITYQITIAISSATGSTSEMIEPVRKAASSVGGNCSSQIVMADVAARSRCGSSQR